MYSTLDLVIGSGPMRNVVIPNLVGRTVAEAKAIIAQNYFLGLVDHEDGLSDDSDIIYYPRSCKSGSVRSRNANRFVGK